MAQRFQNGHRRRRITIITANFANASPGVIAAARSRVVVAYRYPARKPNPRSMINSISTRRITGVIQSPPAGAGGTPKPLQPTWTAGTMRRKTFRNIVRPIIVKQRYVAPKIDGFSNQTVVPSHRPRSKRVVRPTFIASPPTRAMGLVTPTKASVVPTTRRRRRLNCLSIVAAFDAFEMPSPTAMKAVVVPRLALRKVNHRATIALPSDPRLLKPATLPDVIVIPRHNVRRLQSPAAMMTMRASVRVRAPHQSSAIVVPRLVKTQRLRGLSMILPFDAFETPSPSTMRSIVVPSRLKGSRSLRSAVIVAAKASVNPRSIPSTKAIVVPWHEHPSMPPWTISTLYRKFVEPPPEHFPMPRVNVARAPRRSPTMWPRPIASQSIYQFPGNMIDKPWDLIAACIAWLRNDAAIVAAFGDVKGSHRNQKFVSDIELVKTSPPYAVFDEPTEIENYETPDQDGLSSSVANGLFKLTVYTNEKLVARQYAEMLAASLNDAPLKFTDGILLYLRRSERRWPTLISPGNGENVTLYKRVLEFEYLIDRYF